MTHSLRIATAAMLAALPLFSPPFASGVRAAEAGSETAVPSAYSCAEHIKVIDDFIQAHPMPVSIGINARLTAAERRDAAADACDSGDMRTAFINIQDAREALGMPRDTYAALDAARAAREIRDQQAASLPTTEHPGQPLQ